MATIAAILASATTYTYVQSLLTRKGPDGVVVSGPLGVVAKEDGGNWNHYTPIGDVDTPRYPCKGWSIND